MTDYKFFTVADKNARIF